MANSKADPADLAARLRKAVADAQQTLKHAFILAILGMVLIVVVFLVLGREFGGRDAASAMGVALGVTLGIQGLAVALWGWLWRRSLADPKATLPTARIWAILSFAFSLLGKNLVGILINGYIWYRIHQGKKALDQLGSLDVDGSVYASIFD